MTEEEKQELEALRLEKHQRIQQSRAQTALEAAGIPTAFSSLLVGADDRDTDARTEQFCSAYQAALTEDVRKRLPQQPPLMTPPTPQRLPRGVRRIR
ncbi:MAG: DUF4355 domain-containing protein [Ruminococcaceae bacterium]|nr:DUF4355 domain-containing protein [Oscillospiraceae bacterium]